MNDPRVEGEPTPAGRIAAAAVNVFRELRSKRKREADYADVRDGIDDTVRRELIRARIAEAKECGRSDRVKILRTML